MDPRFISCGWNIDGSAEKSTVEEFYRRAEMAQKLDKESSLAADIILEGFSVEELSSTPRAA